MHPRRDWSRRYAAAIALFTGEDKVMADYCQQCSLEIWQHDHGDLAGLSGPEDTAAGLYAVVLCEGCGPIQVDHAGRCVSTDCAREGHHAP
jgi:hypothetical protein